MMILDLSDATARDLDTLLVLNNAHKLETSELDLGRLQHMLDGAFLALTVAGAQALLIGFDQNADYDSQNFLWFRDRYARFVYVDRIIVAREMQGQGVARRFYERLFEVARARGHDLVACEVNSEPPNPGSDAFHQKLGFVPVGQAVLANGKRVRYLVRKL